MKTKLNLLSTFLLLSSIVLYAQQTQQKKTTQENSNSTQAVKQSNQVSSNPTLLIKFPSVITKSSYNDSLTIRFKYGERGRFEQIEFKTKNGVTKTYSFQYKESKIIYTCISSDNIPLVDTLYINNALITKDRDHTYIYENRKLVEIKSNSRIGSHYTIKYDEAGNAIARIRILPPITKDDEEVTQITTYEYDEMLKEKFFFSTDWYLFPILFLNDDDNYGLPSSSLFGSGSTNLVKNITSDVHGSFLYEFLTFDESGYPTHYTIKKYWDSDSKYDVISEYKISYIVIDVRKSK